MLYEVDDIPRIDCIELEELIRESVNHDEFLMFRRRDGDDLDWILGPEPCYECFCTACREHFSLPLSAGPLRGRDTCPKCGAPIKVRQWNAVKGLWDTAFAFHFWQRGAGRSVWLTSCKVRMNTIFLDSKYIAQEYARYVFWDGGSRKWTWNPYSGEWAEIKNHELRHWSTMYNVMPDFFGVFGSLEGSCLEYSCLDRALAGLDDIANYCAMYVKQPMLEYLWKMGLGGWLEARERGYALAFSQCVNLRAREPKKFLKFGKAALRLVQRNQLGLRAACEFRELLTLGAVDANKDGVDFALAFTCANVDFKRLVQMTGAKPRELVRYIRRQAAHGLTDAVIIMLRDYLDQLDRMRIDGKKMPRDLLTAHERLSERERRVVQRDKLGAFRARRRLYRWMRWRHDGMLIRPVDSPYEIVKEGELQDNCVAGYAGRHAAGRTIIMVLRKCSEPRVPWHTVEIDPKTLECRQCYVAHNRQRTPEAAAFMDKYLEHLRALKEAK